jgi:RES domain-containing protein
MTCQPRDDNPLAVACSGWRISKRAYAERSASAFDGEGSRRYGGRWSPAGRRVAYASSSLALASLEYFVNPDPVDAPSDLVSVRVEIPGDIFIETVETAIIPANWRRHPYPRELQLFGERWLMAESSVCLRVPSAVIPEEFNLLVNPLHRDFDSLRFREPAEFEFDPRMWK